MPLKLDKQKKSLFVPGELKSGTKIMMTRRDPQLIAQNAIYYANKLKNRHNHQPICVLQFDCAGRGRVLFGEETSSKVITPLQNLFDKDVAWIGFHTFGEIAPIGNQAYFHNVTVALCAIYDSASNDLAI